MIEDLYKEYQELINSNKKSNGFSKLLKNNKDLYNELIKSTVLLDSYYKDPSELQRLRFLFNEKCINYCNCGKPRGWRNFYRGYNKTCGSNNCIKESNKESSKKYYQDNFGVDHLFQLDSFKEKFKESSLEKYGVDNPGKSKDIIEKIKKTNLDRYGETSWIKIDKNKKKIAEKLSINAIEDRLKIIKENNLNIEVLSFLSGKDVKIYCKDCLTESIFSTSFFNKRLNSGINPCIKCNPVLNSTSNGEIDLYDYISSIYDGIVIKNYRKNRNSKEVDIYLPEVNKGYEFNGIYWHSEIFKDKNYHLYKKKELEEEGIEIYNIWEDDWIYKKELIKSRIMNSLNLSNKIFARKCKIREITASEERVFLNENHIQGYVPSKIGFGLYIDSKLVSIMSFSSNRRCLGSKEKFGEYELLRFCNLLNTTVIGGASKLFNHFIKNYNPSVVISYQDNSWKTGNLYEKLGFIEISNISPNYYWCKGNIRYHRYNYRKDKLVRQGYDPKKSESVIMTERGYFKLWDHGNRKWEYRKKV